MKEDYPSVRPNFCSCGRKGWKKFFWGFVFRPWKSCVFNCDDLLSFNSSPQQFLYMIFHIYHFNSIIVSIDHHRDSGVVGKGFSLTYSVAIIIVSEKKRMNLFYTNQKKEINPHGDGWNLLTLNWPKSKFNKINFQISLCRMLKN